MAESKPLRIPLQQLDAPQTDAPLPVQAVPVVEVLPDGVVGPGRRVRLHFALALEDGTLIDSNFANTAVACTLGDGNLLPGFEQVLQGLRAGDRQDFLLPPEQAFGLFNEDNIQRFPVYQFAPDLPLAKGLVVDFADAAGNSQAGVVRSISGRMVEVDFNHPLAGRSIRFSVHIHAVGEDA